MVTVPEQKGTQTHCDVNQADVKINNESPANQEKNAR